MSIQDSYWVFLGELRKARKEAKIISLENFQTKSYFVYYLSKILSFFFFLLFFSLSLPSILHFVCQTRVPAFLSFLLFLTTSLLFIFFLQTQYFYLYNLSKFHHFRAIFKSKALVHDKKAILIVYCHILPWLEELAIGKTKTSCKDYPSFHFSTWGCPSPSEVLQSSSFIPSLYPILVCPVFFLLFWLQWDLSASWTELPLFTILFWKLPRSGNENSSISSRISKAWR